MFYRINSFPSSVLKITSNRWSANPVVSREFATCFLIFLWLTNTTILKLEVMHIQSQSNFTDCSAMYPTTELFLTKANISYAIPVPNDCLQLKWSQNEQDVSNRFHTSQFTKRRVPPLEYRPWITIRAGAWEDSRILKLYASWKWLRNCVYSRNHRSSLNETLKVIHKLNLHKFKATPESEPGSRYVQTVTKRFKQVTRKRKACTCCSTASKLEKWLMRTMNSRKCTQN
jgi:hypothetical protein